MDKKIKEQLEGSVNVNGDVTPITKQKIDRIDSSKWNQSSISLLQEQLETLRHRYHTAQQNGMSPSVLNQMSQGIQHLEAMILEKLNQITKNGDNILI